VSDSLKALLGECQTKYLRQLAEKFPRIVEKIVSLWNAPEALSVYFQTLLVADRPDRQGFPAAIASALFTLSHFYDDI